MVSITQGCVDLQSFLRSKIIQCAEDSRGATAIVFAVVLPLLMLAAVGSIDTAIVYHQHSTLQDAADAGAIAAAQELQIADIDDSTIKAVAHNTIKAQLSEKVRELNVDLKVDQEAGTVEVRVDHRIMPPVISGVYGTKEERIYAQATARVTGTTRVCILALNESGAGAISLEKSARVTGNECAVFSNSVSENGLKAKGDVELIADLICSAGGYSGSKGYFDPEPTTDCPPFPDPLADRAEPNVGGCLEKKLKISEDDSLSPGTYCGGLTISAGADVNLSPGIYVINGGNLDVSGGLYGRGVGFYLTGGARFKFAKSSSIELYAPVDGPMAGLLFFEGRSSSGGKHQIRSDDARVLEGTIYLANSSLIVDAGNTVADESAYTAIITQSLKLFEGPHLVLNSNYDDTDIPAPEGISKVNRHVVLSK